MRTEVYRRVEREAVTQRREVPSSTLSQSPDSRQRGNGRRNPEAPKEKHTHATEQWTNGLQQLVSYPGSDLTQEREGSWQAAILDRGQLSSETQNSCRWTPTRGFQSLSVGA